MWLHFFSFSLPCNDNFVLVVELPQRKLYQKALETKGVYILDCFSDVFVW